MWPGFLPIQRIREEEAKCKLWSWQFLIQNIYYMAAVLACSTAAWMVSLSKADFLFAARGRWGLFGLQQLTQKRPFWVVWPKRNDGKCSFNYITIIWCTGNSFRPVKLLVLWWKGGKIRRRAATAGALLPDIASTIQLPWWHKTLVFWLRTCWQKRGILLHHHQHHQKLSKVCPTFN